ncbi:Bax inhibitor-1/YccA family protein [Arcanobacterium pinnipediorum]|uniref:Bax inhibitor-1/YccA family protein n=1 Tax=Arcanobacterium pinnipediorum TaxID=1503041 RepID=A0ABY5AGZ9_9ACTO|nr:Bax inhibitor-1/YccA family protein [Arcanobacterium pinnipediorum]USR79198.1 Bax inhibitor-1/YccA family protein [Arcanobacterium pinnipediorum]
MSNPVISRNPYFTGETQRPNQFGQQQTNVQPDMPAQPNYSAFDPQPVEGRMTYTDAMNKVALLLGVTVVTGIVAAFVVPTPSMPAVAMISSFAALGLGFFAAFKPMVSPGLAIAYAAIEGVALGTITSAFNMYYPGIAFQAILATMVIVGVTLGLHYSGAVRTTKRGRKIVYVVALGYLVFSLINVVLTWTGILGGFGLRNGPFGLLIGAAMILVAAYMLIADFEQINEAIAHQAPTQFAWTAALAIVMTILWIYIEVLRLLAILANNR